jgi:ethanolamine utilization microcompartment shell protein EutS
MPFEKILTQFSKPSDLSIFLVSFAIGFFLDAHYWHTGVQSGTVAGAFAIGFLGIKKGLDAILSSTYVTKKLMKNRIKLLEKFSGNEGVLLDIHALENILSAELIDFDTFNTLLSSKIQSYLNQKLKVFDLYDQDKLLAELEKFHDLVNSSTSSENTEAIKTQWEKLDSGFFNIGRKENLAASALQKRPQGSRIPKLK